MIDVRVGRDDGVQTLDAERLELLGDEILVGTGVDEDGGATGTLDQGRVALSDVQEPGGDVRGRS